MAPFNPKLFSTSMFAQGIHRFDRTLLGPHGNLLRGDFAHILQKLALLGIWRHYLVTRVRSQAHCRTLCPPSIVIVSPVRNSHPASRMRPTSRPTSHAVPILFTGIRRAIRSRTAGSARADEFSSVSTYPGAKFTTLMPIGAHSSASVRVIDANAAFAAE